MWGPARKEIHLPKVAPAKQGMVGWMRKDFRVIHGRPSVFKRHAGSKFNELLAVRKGQLNEKHESGNINLIPTK